jgi:two-component system CheB/CheR fusion protein
MAAAAVPFQKEPVPVKAFPIVGLGASAGGLEALEEFFTHMPPDSGMAFVVVTHQHPGHTSLLPELLRKCTQMPVREAKDAMRLEPNFIYISGSEGYLAMLNGALQLMAFEEPRGLRLPIDCFFRSLAEDQRERAIGIVLSGTGTDGTLGLRAIKGAAGMAMAQDPESAKYSGMPRSAVATGLVDYVLRADQMPARLVVYAQGPYLVPMGAALPADATLPEPMQKIIVLLRSRTGHDFSAYKPTTVRRRIERRINVHQFAGPQQYLSYLQENPHELDLLFKELVIGVTSFFRESDAFEALAKTGLPQLLQSKPDDAALRVWVPGCSTGEEAYSLAIVLQERLERLKKRLSVQIFGTDWDSEAIDISRTGLYPEGIAVDVPRERLARFFVKEDSKYRIKKEIREMVVFAPQNVLKDPPFTKLDLVSCRNLLIYVNAEAQQRLLALFHCALKPQGLLFLGPSESLGELSDHFAAVDKKWKVFRRKEIALASPPLAELTAGPADVAPGHAVEAAVAERPRELHVSAVFDKLLLHRFAPASVVINERGDVSYIHGRTGNYLEPAAGGPRLNILEMAREGLRVELAAALRRAVTQQGEVAHEGVRVKSNGGFALVDVAVHRITEPESLRGLLLVTFRPSPSRIPRLPAKKKAAGSKTPSGRIEELERELQFTKESLQSTAEEWETSNEELRSTNEELQSTNEELQSANEELETSKEEMQSLNEELQTVNAQLQSKMEALSQTSDDLQNLLNSTTIATIFLDGHLRIKRFTEEATKVIHLIPSDAGRPIGDLVSSLNYDPLVADAAEVLRTLIPKEKEVQTQQGDWRLLRILPYRTTENVIDGLVITLVDISRSKRAEQAAQHARALAEGIVATVRGPLLVLDKDLRVASANRAFYRFFKVNPGEVEKRPVYELSHQQWDIPKLRELLEDILPRNSSFEDFEVEHDFPGLGRRVMLLNAHRIEQQSDLPGLILLAIEDVTGRRRRNRRVNK